MADPGEPGEIRAAGAVLWRPGPGGRRLDVARGGRASFPATAVAAVCGRPGFVPLARGALDLAARGITTLTEALAVTSGIDDRAAPEAGPVPAQDSLVEEALEADAIARGN